MKTAKGDLPRVKKLLMGGSSGHHRFQRKNRFKPLAYNAGYRICPLLSRKKISPSLEESNILRRDKFIFTKEVLTSNRTIMSLLFDENLAEHAHEKLTRLVGMLSFVCLGGIWDEEGVSQASNRPFLETLNKCSVSLEDCPYGDIFKGDDATKMPLPIIVPS